ncbi:MAG: Na+/H+ antiporter NhaA [Gammaproteobacteria bacterium]|nr:Na+/H+ antiporter NhaA [Gammaproteobacteria bacterium]
MPAAHLKLWPLRSMSALLDCLVLGLLGGIGFTMSIFIADLAFPDASMLRAAKLAVLGPRRCGRWTSRCAPRAPHQHSIMQST